MQSVRELVSFYMSSIGATGWPYVQHRGGPKGFLKVIDQHTIAFADFRGNKQFVSTGNIATDSRVALIMVDYPQQARLKILGHAEIFEDDRASGWIELLRDPSYKAVIERAFVVTVAGQFKGKRRKIQGPFNLAGSLMRPAGALPAKVFTAEHEVSLNKTRIHLKYYGPAHTDSDVSVNFTDANVVHVADTWWNGVYPL